MKSSEFTGRSSVMRAETPWLASEDILELGDVEVVIKACYFHKQAEFEDGRKEDVYALAFEGKKKQLVLNATNRRRLVSLYGVEASRWKGKKITLHVVKLKAWGEECYGIRIR